MRTDLELRELLPAYVLGALEGEELDELERRLAAGSPELEAELFEWSRQLESLAEAAPPVEPSELTRTALMRRIAAGAAELPVVEPRRSAAWPAWAAAAALALVTGWGAWNQSQLRDEIRALQAERLRYSQDVVSLRTDLERTRLELRQVLLAQQIVAAPGARATVLAGLDPAPAASARTFHDPAARQAVFYASGLPAAAAGTTYQLWFIGADGPVSAGIFDVDASGSGSLVVPAVDDPDTIMAWAVTVEAAGGVAQPTLDAMVLMG